MDKHEYENIRLRPTLEVMDEMITMQGFKNVCILIVMCAVLAFLTFMFLDLSRKLQIIITGCLLIFLILYAIFSDVLKEENKGAQNKIIK